MCKTVFAVTDCSSSVREVIALFHFREDAEREAERIRLFYDTSVCNPEKFILVEKFPVK